MHNSELKFYLPGGSRMHAMSVESGVEAFVELGILVIEGRVPCLGTQRGYKEGPHCPGPMQRTSHFCDTPNSFLCTRVEKLRKHMALLCSNAVPMCVEVLLCAGCQCGKDRSECTDVAVIPSPTDLLLEQWTVSLVKNSGNPAPMNIRGLLQAVRSQLHFSQLSAWWSNSKGTSPENVCYRLTLPGQAFSSQFSRQPLEHSFPIASVNGSTDIKVSVRTLPRSDSILVVNCPLHSTQTELTVRKRSITSSEQPHLGESLLDPPGPRPPDRIAPSTNPQVSNWRSSSSRQRIGRQSMAAPNRRQDTPASSTTLIEKLNCSQSSRNTTESTVAILPGLVDDRMQTGCDKAGKHRCSCGEEELECPTATVPGPRHRRRSQVTNPNINTTNPSVIPAATNGNNAHSVADSGAASSYVQPPKTGKKFNFELSQREVEEVLTVLRTRTPCGVQYSNYKPEKVTKSDYTSKMQLPCTKSKQFPSYESNSSVVNFLHEEKPSAPAKSDLLLSAILRTSKNAEKCSVKNGFKENRTAAIKPSVDLSCDKKKPCDNSKKILLSDNFRTHDSSESTPQIDSSVNSNDLWSGFRTNDVVDRTKSALCSIVDRFRTRPCVRKQTPNEENSQADEVVGSEDVKEYDFVSEDSVEERDLNKQNLEGAGVARVIPTALDKAKFRQSLDSAASMVFHWRTGLPLTSSPAPLRRASQRFDFDSSINCVSAIRSALFDPPDHLSVCSEDTESEGSSKSPCSPTCLGSDQHLPIWPNPSLPPCSSLLGSFEESVLNGRLEPVSTVQGFTADLGASGSFCPRHIVLPVTVFFYTLGDNDKVSTPYMGHINLGKKGYVVPRNGTIQVTLLNPLGTVIKMFVVMYDLSDMPPHSCTFLRQRTFFMPALQENEPVENAQKYLRYLIHLRFSSSKSGRISLHTDIRMIIFRKSDLDTATGHGFDMAYELRSFTHGPNNPKFSPRPRKSVISA